MIDEMENQKDSWGDLGKEGYYAEVSTDLKSGTHVHYDERFSDQTAVGNFWNRHYGFRPGL
jgi:hypothetical protein